MFSRFFSCALRMVLQHSTRTTQQNRIANQHNTVFGGAQPTDDDYVSGLQWAPSGAKAQDGETVNRGIPRAAWTGESMYLKNFDFKTSDIDANPHAPKAPFESPQSRQTASSGRSRGSMAPEARPRCLAPPPSSSTLGRARTAAAARSPAIWVRLQCPVLKSLADGRLGRPRPPATLRTDPTGRRPRHGDPQRHSVSRAARPRGPPHRPPAGHAC